MAIHWALTASTILFSINKGQPEWEGMDIKSAYNTVWPKRGRLSYFTTTQLQVFKWQDPHEN